MNKSLPQHKPGTLGEKADKEENEGGKKKQVNVMNYSKHGLHSRGQRSLTPVTGSERERGRNWNKWS